MKVLSIQAQSEPEHCVRVFICRCSPELLQCLSFLDLQKSEFVILSGKDVLQKAADALFSIEQN